MASGGTGDVQSHESPAHLTPAEGIIIPHRPFSLLIPHSHTSQSWKINTKSYETLEIGWLRIRRIVTLLLWTMAGDPHSRLACLILPYCFTLTLQERERAESDAVIAWVGSKARGDVVREGGRQPEQDQTKPRLVSQSFSSSISPPNWVDWLIISLQTQLWLDFLPTVFWWQSVEWRML